MTIYYFEAQNYVSFQEKIPPSVKIANRRVPFYPFFGIVLYVYIIIEKAVMKKRY